MMKTKLLATSLAVTLALCGCSKSIDSQSNTAKSSSQTTSANQPITEISPPPVSASLQNEPAISSAQLLAEHFANSKNSNASKLHELLLQDPRDGAWAYQGEALIKQRISALASSASIEISKIECRSTMCEVLATTGNPAEIDRWQDVVYGANGLLSQTGFGDPSIEFTNTPDGRVVIVTHIIRQKELGQQRRT